MVGTDPFAGFEQFKFRYAKTDYTHTEFEGDEIGTVFDSDTDDLRLELRHNPWGRWSGAFGLQYTEVDFNAEGDEAFVPPSNTETGALFWVESVEFERWQLDLGLRYEDIDVTALELLEEHGHDDDEDEHDEHEDESVKRGFKPFSISAGAIWHVTDTSHLTFNLSRAERAPTAQELFSNGPHIASQTFEVGDSQLQKESNMHVEAGYRIHGERLSASFILDADWFDDFIYQQNTGEEEDDPCGFGPDRMPNLWVPRSKFVTTSATTTAVTGGFSVYSTRSTVNWMISRMSPDPADTLRPRL